MYDTLAAAVKNYATTKGEWYTRLQSIKDTYNGVTEDFEGELTADLIGDYLFTDSEFLERFSVEHRNVFQKLWDEVKYLCRIASAGSKEARQLEKVKKAFEDAYRNTKPAEKSTDTNSDGVIRFSLMNNASFAENVENVLNMNNEVALKNREQGNFVRIMNDTPSVILENIRDSENHEIIIRFDALYLAARKSGVLEGHYHDLGKEIMIKLPQYISNPDAIVRMNNGRINIFTIIETPKGNNGIISMELNTVKDINSKNEKYNLVISVFSSKDNYTRNNLIKNGIYVEYKKEDLSQVNHQLYEWLATVNDKSSNNSVPQDTSAVNNNSMQSGRKNSLTFENQSREAVGDYNVYGRDVKLASDEVVPAQEKQVDKEKTLQEEFEDFLSGRPMLKIKITLLIHSV